MAQKISRSRADFMPAILVQKLPGFRNWGFALSAELNNAM
jgi:hypothetical protein